MAGYARMYEALGPLYKGNTSAAPSSADQRPSLDSGQRHPAPGSGSGSVASRKKLDSDDSDDGGTGKNDSLGTIRPRSLGARASQRSSGGDDEGSKRPGSPLPLGSSRTRSSLQDRSSLSPRPSLRIPSGDDRPLNSRTTAGEKPGSSKSYDSTDNMRLRGDDPPSPETLDTAGYRPMARSGTLSRSRQGDEKSDPDLSLTRSRPRSTLRDNDPPMRRLRDRDGKNSGDDSPPRKSLDRFEIPNRRRRNLDDEDDLSLRRRKVMDDPAVSRNLTGTGDRDRLQPSRSSALDDLPRRRRRDLDDGSDSPPLRSTSREEPLSNQRDLAGKSSGGILPERRRKIIDDKDDSPPLKSDEIPVRRRRDLGTTSERASSPPLRSTSRDDFPPRRRYDQKGPDDKYSTSQRLSPRSGAHQKLSSHGNDLDETSSDSPPRKSDELPLRRRKDLASERDTSPPLRSTSREDLSLRRRSNKLTEREPSPPRTGPASRESLSLSPRRQNAAPDRKIGRDLSPPRSSLRSSQLSRENVAETSDSRGLKATPRGDKEQPKTGMLKRAGPNEGLTRRRNVLDKRSDESSSDSDSSLGKKSKREADRPPIRFSLDGKGGRSLSPPAGKSTRKSPREDGPLSRGKDLDKKFGRDLSPPRVALRAGSRDELSLRSRRGGDDGSGTTLSGTSPRLGARDDIPLHRKGAANEQPSEDKRRVAPKAALGSSSRDDLPLGRKRSTGDKGDKDLSPKAVARTDRLSPRRTSILDDGKAASPRVAAKVTSRDDFSLDRQKETGGKPARDLSPPRAAQLKPGSRDRLQAPLGRQGGVAGKSGDSSLTSPRASLSLAARSTHRSAVDDEKDRLLGKQTPKVTSRGDPPSIHSDNLMVGADEKNRPGRDDFGYRKRLGLTDPAGFDFAKHDQKHRLVKLKRSLPVNLSGTRYEIVQQAARHIGFAQSADDDFKTPFLIWTDSFVSVERMTQMKPFQRLNHFPGMTEIARKDLLAKNLGKLAALHPDQYNFAPRTWCLPGELQQFQQYATASQKSEKTPKKSFISKPIDGASGRGIKIYKTAEDVPQSFDGECVLQEYVPNPFLIDNVKFDLRLYVLVTSCDPLRVYFYNDGFIRMSTEPYVEPLKCTLEDGMAFMHLTNSSVNKLNQAEPESAAKRRSNLRGGNVVGNKRPLRFLNDYLQKGNYDVAMVWRNIIDLMVKTVFAAYPHLVRSYRQCRPADGPASGSVCFELLGFDILLDANLKPWLLEVNRSPSFDADQTAERDTKLQLLEETLMLLNISPSDRKRASAAGAPKLETGNFATGSAKEQRELADLAALLARLKRQERQQETDARVCQRFRRIFPSDDQARQEKLVKLMLGAFPALLEANAGQLQRETEAFYTNKLSKDEVAKKLAQQSSKTVQQLTADSGDSSSGEEENAEGGRRKIGREGAGGRKLVAADKSKSPAAGRSAGEGTRKQRQARQKQKQQQQQHADEVKLSECERLAGQALKFLNHLNIRFPGKSSREAEQMLRGLQDNWLARKADVGAYWRLSLDADKRRKVLDIARQNVQVALDKAFRGAFTASATDTVTSATAARTATSAAAAATPTTRLLRLFEKLYNRLLWCKGQGLWETFSGGAAWEGALRQARDAPTQAEMNCCRRVVQLCQDCLLIVFLYADAAQQQQQQQQDQQQQLQFRHQQPVAVS